MMHYESMTTLSGVTEAGFLFLSPHLTGHCQPCLSGQMFLKTGGCFASLIYARVSLPLTLNVTNE